MARAFDPAWFDEVDLVLPVDHEHADLLERLAGNGRHRRKIRLLRSFDPEAVEVGSWGWTTPGTAATRHTTRPTPR